MFIYIFSCVATETCKEQITNIRVEWGCLPRPRRISDLPIHFPALKIVNRSRYVQRELSPLLYHWPVAGFCPLLDTLRYTFCSITTPVVSLLFIVGATIDTDIDVLGWCYVFAGQIL